MEEAVSEHIFGVAKKTGSAAYMSLLDLEEYVTHHHEADYIKKTHELLESIGGSVTHEDAFHLEPTDHIDSSQFEA